MLHEDHEIRIITHPLCPHGQRLRLVLLRKGLMQGVDFVMTYLDLAELPGWFHEVSPAGKMPVVSVDGDHLFDVDAASELLDEVTAGRMHPRRPLTRAHHRQAARKAGVALDALKQIFTAKSDDGIEQGCATLFESLAPLEAQLHTDSPAWDGERFGHVDAAYAPVFSLALFYPWLRSHHGWRAMPTVRAWGEALVASSDVLESRCPNYDGEFVHFFSLFSSAFAQRRSERAA
jgi:glutathione S-transferase